MVSQFTEEQLRLAIGNEIINNEHLTESKLIEKLFDPKKSSISSVIKCFISKEFFRQSKNFCRFATKQWIVDRLKNGSSDFIRDFMAARKQHEIMKIFPEDLQTRLLTLKNENALGSLLIECSRLFNRLREKFAPSSDEDRFRNYLEEWFQSGFMSLTIWEIFKEWKCNGSTLTNLKIVKWPIDIEKDNNWRNFQRQLKSIKTDNFVEVEKLENILNKFLTEPTVHVKNDTVEVIGKMVYLSQWTKTIQYLIKSNNATQIAIFAKDTLTIDCDLVDDVWQGKNLIMVSNVIFVWQNSKIQLSGTGFNAGNTKAVSATSTKYKDIDGKDGRAGESSGNIAILAAKMFNSSKLTVELNGGRGEDGQDGGDGYDGQNGVGVTKSDLDRLVVDYYSLYRDSWTNFQNYSPPSNWTKQSDYGSSGDYIRRKFKDEQGRVMTFSLAADKGWTYTTYELYFLICGSNGTSGTSGGSNGVGGQGGYNGTCTVQNTETGEEFQINIIRNGKSSGPSGKNGVVGKSGKHGINGNDMAFIDRSAQEASKHYEGSTERKLTWSYVYNAECKSRLDGYRRYHAKENACFIKFNQGKTIDTSERRAIKAQEGTVRTSASEAVAKQSIIISNVLSQAETIFGKENVFLGDTCKAIAEVTANEDEVEEEEEIAEHVNEEVVVLRQKDEGNKLIKYTPESEKKKRPVYSPEMFANYVKSIGRRTTVNTCAQILFDLFTIEFSASLLDSIALHTLYHQIHYRQNIQSSFSLLLVSVLQFKIVNGKTYNEIKQFTEKLFIRRKSKFNTTRLRHKLQNITLEVDSAVVNPSMAVISDADKQFGIKECQLSAKLTPYTNETQVKKVVSEFFSQYVANKVDVKLLGIFYDFLKNTDKSYHEQFALFVQDSKFQWTDIHAVTAHLNTLKAWLIEEAALKEKKKNNKDNLPTTQENELPTRAKTKLESDFETFLETVASNLKHWNVLIKPIKDHIANNSEYTTRFGAPPSFEKSGYFASFKAVISSGSSVDETFIEQAQYLIKIYFLAKTILTYNKRLYICNAIMLKEQKMFSADLLHDNEDDFHNFLFQLKQNPVPSDTDQCEVYMTKYGLACGAFRYLLSIHLNIKLCSYLKVSFQTLQKIETFNSTATECELLWLQDNLQPVGIAPDEEFRRFVEAQQAVLTKYYNDLIAENSTYINRDYNQKENQYEFASYFPQPLQDAVIEWMENYIALTQDQLFLHVLHNRFWIDGCHFSLFELQFILASCASLRTLHHCDINYLLLLANSAPQSQLIDVFLYTTIEYHYGNRFSPKSKIFTGIPLIPNSHYKALLAVKLNSYNFPIDENDLYKIILMLQHASNGSEQLIKISLDEWISIAQKQKWSEIGYLLKKYGSIGYYLGVLDSKGFKEEEEKMRNIIDQATIIPEKVIALYTNWIVTKEIKADDKFFEELKESFTHANKYPELKDKITKHQLVTTEIEQAKLINWMSTGQISEDHVSYECFNSINDRDVDELSEKITGLHDSPEEADKRREVIKNIAELLRLNDSINSPSIKWLNKFDDALYKLKTKRLRDTQKIAILCAVESEKHVLEQVNTGEGKSFIIAAIATIHCKTGKRYVDIITSSPVLAQRDAAEMSKLYNELGLTVADNCSEDFETRKKAYTADIVYGDIARFQRDYLLHAFYKKPLKGDRTQIAVVVDEVDNMLLDNGNNMLYLSHSVPGMDLLDSLFIFIQQQIYSPIYTGDKNNIEQMQEQFDNTTIKKKILTDIFGQFSLADLTSITALNYSKHKIEDIFNKLIKKDIIDVDGYLRIYQHDQVKLIDEALTNVDRALIIQIEACFSVIISRERSIELPTYLRNFAKLHLDELIENCKHALFLEANTEYVVDIDHTGKLTTALEQLVTIIDSNTGADLATSQWCGGLHQFLQLKHGCRISPMSLKAVFVSNVAYLKRYKIINGLSGTLGSIEESKTLIELYNADLIKIPTNKPKIFYEHVPVIAIEQKEWIQNIYDEICDQITGKRSVLLICEDIKQLEYILNGLNGCFATDKSATKEVSECFTNITVYKREHDEFNFEDDHKLEQYRLIIATNLAGRGTDIKLSSNLIETGGLHVITGFMPKNCRIEEQAFGRAARCGQPGSAQIIAFIEKADNTVQPSVFQLKMFRDNAEVHRLQSLKSFYDYHTEIEESCLEKFRDYCDRALNAIYSNSFTINDESLPTPSQVVYFALLDQWALWLDAKAPLIKQCAKEHSQHVKETLINSVDNFLREHPFGNQSNCFEVAKQWIDAPQSLLTIGIIQMHHENGFQDTDDTFNKIIANGHEFAAEAHYYKGCIRMRNFCETRQKTTSLKLNNNKSFEENIEEAIEHFYKARTLFLNRLQRKQKEASLVAQLIEKAPENNPKTSGFASQQNSITTYIQLILTNIDYLLGAPCKPEMFTANDISEMYSKEIYDAFYRQGLISPTLLTGRKMENWQIEPFRRKYKLHKKQLETLIRSMSKDLCSLSFENYVVLDRNLILKKCPLSTKSEFWAELEQQKALYNTEMYLVIHDKSLLSEEVIKVFDQLIPYSLTDPEEAKTIVRYSSDSNMGTMYKLKEVEDLMGNNQKFKEEINQLVNKGSIKLDKMAKILMVPNDMSYFSQFDGVTTDDFKEFFNLTNHGAGWIINTLGENGILELQTVQMTRCTVNNETWTNLVRIHLKPESKEPQEDDPIELKLLFKYAEVLQRIKDNTKLLNVTEEVIALYCNISTENDKEKTTKIFYDYLIKQNILESYLYNIWRLNSKLDCSSLPTCIANEIDEFLSDRFAYSFALENLCLSLEAANKDHTSIPNQIFLPENPFSEVFDDFIQCGLAMPPRLLTSIKDFGDFDYEDFKHEEIIKSVVYSNRLKLYDQTDYHMKLIPFATYVLDQGFTIDSDLRAIINNGLKVVVTRKQEKAGCWLISKVFAGAAWCWNKIKAAASTIASVGYSIVKFCIHLPGKIFSKISEYAAPYVELVGRFIQKIAKPLLNSKLGKAAVAKMQFAKETVINAGYKALEGAEWVISKGTEGVNYLGQKATEGVKWIAETTFTQGAAQLGRDFGSWITSTSIWKSAAEMAIYLYTKMNSFCTAVFESYHYYNQCRTASRRLVIEKQGLVDEHIILKTFNGISQEEAKKNAANYTTEETIRKHIASWRYPLIKFLMSIFNKKLHQLPKDKYTVGFIKTSLQNSFAFKDFENEINNLLTFHAWMTQISYFKVIQNAAQNNTPFKNIDFESVKELPTEFQFFIEDAIDKILEEFETLTHDEGYESDTKSTTTHTSNNIFTEGVEYDNWKDAFNEPSTNLIKKSVDFVFIDQTISVILAYIASLHDTNLPPSEAQFNFTQEDKSLKEALVEYKSSNQSKRKAQFLMTELHSIIHKAITYNDVNKNILKTAIKYGYPLPLSAAKIIATAIDNFLTKSEIYKSGIFLEIKNDKEEVLVRFSTKEGKAKIVMRDVNEVIFLCQTDYHAYVGISNQKAEVDNAFFYEALVGYLKDRRSKFPRQAETLREGILNEL